MTINSRIQGIVLSDAEGVIRHWSQGAQCLFGYSAEEAEGQLLDLIVPPEHRDAHWKGFRLAMATGTCGSDRAAVHLPVRCKGGSIRIFPARFVFLQDVRGNAAGALVIYSESEGEEAPFGSEC